MERALLAESAGRSDAAELLFMAAIDMESR
jgi:hypothetical protein